MYVKYDGRAELVGARDGGIEIAEFEPKQDAVSNPHRGVAHGAVMMINVPSVELKNQSI